MSVPPEAAATGRLAWAGVVLLGLCGALAAVLEALLVPLYVGSVVFPVTILLAILSNVTLPRMARTLVPGAGAAIVPFAGWLVAIVGFGLITRPEGDVILPGGDLQWVTYGLLLGGAVAGAVTIALSAPAPSAPAAPAAPAGPADTRPASRRGGPV